MPIQRYDASSLGDIPDTADHMARQEQMYIFAWPEPGDTDGFTTMGIWLASIEYSKWGSGSPYSVNHEFGAWWTLGYDDYVSTSDAPNEMWLLECDQWWCNECWLELCEDALPFDIPAHQWKHCKHDPMKHDPNVCCHNCGIPATDLHNIS